MLLFLSIYFERYYLWHPARHVPKHLPRLVFLSVMMIVVLESKAQHPIYKQYQVEEGLPSQEVYEAFQDQEGFLWVATDKGLARYDGYTFERYSQMDGLLDNSVLAICADDKGRLWFPASSGGLAFWEKDAFHPYPFNDTLLAHIPGGNTDRIHVEPSGAVWIVPLKKPGLLHISAEGVAIWHYLNYDSSTVFVKQFSDGDLLTGLCELNDYSSVDPATSMVIETEKGKAVVTSLSKKLTRRVSEAISLKNGQIIFADHGKLYRIEGDRLIDEYILEGPIISVYDDDRSQLWVTTEDAVYVFPPEKFSEPEKWFENQGVCFVVQDREGGYWLPSLTKGLFYLPPLPWFALRSVSGELDQRSVITIDIEDKWLAIAYSSGDVEVQHSLAQPRSNPLFYQNAGHMPEVLIDQGMVWAGKNQDLKTVDGLSVPNVLQSLGRTLRMVKTKRNTLLCANISGFMELKDGQILWKSHEFGFSERTTAIAEDERGHLTIGTRHGLYKMVGDSIARLWPELTGHVTDIVNGPDSSQWILTHGSGVYVLHDGHCIALDTLVKLTSQMTTRGFKSEDGSIWVGTNRGLNRIVVDQWKPFSARVETHATMDGLPSNQVNDIDQWNDTLLVSTNKGIAAIAMDKISTNQVTPLLRLNEVYVNQNLYSVSESLQLSHDQDDLLIHFLGIGFRHERALLYRYQLAGQDDDSVYTTDRVARYTNLSPGDYTFYLAVCNGDGVWSKTEQMLKLSIDAHFKDELWFRVLMVIACVLILVMICLLVINNQRRHERSKRNRMIAEQKALLAQMNPHFMFNSLNAIQLFVARNQKGEANLYLSRFSKLMRLVLTFSGKRWVTLEEELESLRLYLQLEKLRFEDQIEYSIYIDPALDMQEILIPPMLLQPLLENAIWHGLTPKNTPGKLSLKLEADGEFLCCTVQDDGVGRAAAMVINQKRSEGYQASGLANIRDRLRLVFAKHREAVFMTVEDLIEDDRPAGTRVSLRLPLNSLSSD